MNINLLLSSQIKFLLEKGYDPNHRVYRVSHYTAFSFSEALKMKNHNRSASDRDQIVKLLHQYGANVDSQDQNGRYALTVAALTGDQALLELLLSYNPSKVAKIQGNKLFLV